MQVQLLGDGKPGKEYAVIFAKGDEAYSGLVEFAERFHIGSAHFTAIGALSSGTFAWFDPSRKLYKAIPIDTQVEVLSMVGDIALYEGKPTVRAHMVMVTVDPVDPDTGLALIDPSLTP